jgi:hypothetical protein
MKVAPTAGDNCPYTCLTDRLEQNGSQRLRVVDHDASETNIDWGKAYSEEGFELRVRLVVWNITEKESAYI